MNKLLKKKKHRGFTMIEVMVVVVIIAVFILIALFAYQKQLLKGRDAKRKADLNKLQNVLEDYLNDNIRYPEELVCGSEFTPYLSQIPCDPKNSSDYQYSYQTDDTGEWYIIYVNLENEDDPAIAEAGCEGGCGPGCTYNYGVSSPNVGLEPCECSGWYACQEGICNATQPESPYEPKFCEDPCCGDACFSNAPECQ